MKRKGYYWARARCIGRKVADWEMVWCDGNGGWHVCEYGVEADPIPEAELPIYFAALGRRIEPPDDTKEPAGG